MSKRIILKYTIAIAITVLIAILVGYFVPKAFGALFYNANYEPQIEEAKERFQKDLNQLSALFAENNLIDETPSNKTAETKTCVNHQMSFSADNLNVNIALDYKLLENISYVTVEITENGNELSDINALESEKIKSILAILDTYFKTKKFMESESYFEKKHLIDNYDSSKDNMGVVEYNLATHGDQYEASCIWKTETVYSYSVSKSELSCDFKLLVKYCI